MEAKLMQMKFKTLSDLEILVDFVVSNEVNPVINP